VRQYVWYYFMCHENVFSLCRIILFSKLFSTIVKKEEKGAKEDCITCIHKKERKRPRESTAESIGCNKVGWIHKKLLNETNMA
jgi:hypothetical protein